MSPTELTLGREEGAQTSVDPILLLIGQLVQAGNLCMGEFLLTPALILMYSTIDILASLDSDLQVFGTTRERFEEWITRFFPSDVVLGLSPTDLYSARCGLIHSFTAHSTLVKKGEAAKVFYALHEPEARQLRSALKEAGETNIAVLNVEFFADALTKAGNTFRESLRCEPERLEWAIEKAQQHLTVWRRHGTKLTQFPANVADLRKIADGGIQEGKGND